MALTQANADVLGPSLTGTTTGALAATDAGKMCLITAGVTVNASIFNVGDMIMVYNTTSGALIITAGTNVTFRLSGTTSTGNRTLSNYAIATLLCVVGGATPTFVCSGAGLT
jgi:hypothetical protein